MKNKTNIAIIPAGNRPVVFTLPEYIGSINKDVKIFTPPEEILGDLKTPADSEKILEWLEKTISKNKINYIICALDTIAYGGLIPSRWSEDSKEAILSRLESFKKIIEPLSCKVFSFSSIMRISDSNVNEEEKAYWNKFGKLIFKYSYLRHKLDVEPGNLELFRDFQEVKQEIPDDILDDYLKTRQRNFSINKLYLNWLEQGIFDFLIYGKDDTAPLGINVQEAQFLKREIKEKKAVMHTGSDEIASLLLARILKTEFNREISVFPIFSTPTGAEIIPRYEDMPLKNSLKKHLEICNIKIAKSKKEADMVFLLHTPQQEQNDFALQKFSEQEYLPAVDFCVKTLKTSGKPIILADVCCTNGADNLLSEKIFEEKAALNNLYGYAAWNTASNSIGTTLATGISRYIAEKENSFSQENFNRLLFTRFADDWAYQSIARQKIRSISDKANEHLLYKEMFPLITKLARIFEINPSQLVLSFPCNRTFEIEIKF